MSVILWMHNFFPKVDSFWRYQRRQGTVLCLGDQYNYGTREGRRYGYLGSLIVKSKHNHH